MPLFSSPASRAFPQSSSRVDASGRPRVGGKGVLSSQAAATAAAGRGKTSRGIGLKGHKRMRKLVRDTIQGVTKGDIRRLARRGGVKRISGTIYDDTRRELKRRLEEILRNVCFITEHSNRKTVTVTDVIYALRRMGTPVYGFEGMGGSKKTTLSH
ncbi:histone-fold-containing protein [Stipitochalara longipes BDJ]|nr:histone-fold-containing protein [Stipitochalara longipes BDJ]